MRKKGVLSGVSQEDIDNAIRVANRIVITYTPYKRKPVPQRRRGLTYKEIAGIERITEAEAKWICTNAIKKIRRAYNIKLARGE